MHSPNVKSRLKYEELNTRLTRNQTKCECFVCCEGRSTLVKTKPPIVNLLEISNENKNGQILEGNN